MQNILLVIDMQNDFIDGALGTPEAVAIVPSVREKIRSFDGTVLFTRDTHGDGWQIRPELEELRVTEPIDKGTFGSDELGKILRDLNDEDPIGIITVIGLCTDICVISNALLAKAFLPEVPIEVDASCCAGVTPESHENALKAMASCQIRIVR